MSRTAFLPLAAAAVVAASGAFAEVAAVELPRGFDGRYAPEGVTCGDALVITVEKGVMIGGDGAMTVTDLIEDPVNPRKVEATLLNEGGGGEWMDSAVLTLAEDGKSLR
ncbi:hypothetical protein [Tabrizicola sp.]|uniref:hypothetical protein n=1 Tax=Tabrizicola sp. TaxID=2005166 RepID=UPI003F312C14